MSSVQQDNQLTGPSAFAHAIEVARDNMLKAPWYLYSIVQDFERAAADKQLKHYIAAALDQGFVFHDPYHPELRCLDQHSQYGLFNPDNRYHIATIASDGVYVIRGNRGSSASFELQVGSGNPGFDIDLTSPITIDQMTQDDLQVDENGNFEIVISNKKVTKNWLCIKNEKGAANSILIRESFMDWQAEKSGTWYIERIDSRGEPRPIASADVVNQQYARASEYLINSSQGWLKFVDGIRANLAGNLISPPRKTVNGLPGQWNSAGWFAIDPKMAIVITVPNSPAPYQSIQIGDFWFSALDYCQRQTSLTRTQATQSADGKYRFVISVDDPQVPNWLDPSGNAQIFAFLRWQGLPKCYEFSDMPRVDRVKMTLLDEFLKDEPKISLREREKQLIARKAASMSSPRGF